MWCSRREDRDWWSTILNYAGSIFFMFADVVQAWESRLVGAMAAVLELGGAGRPTQAARTVVNFIRGFELERLVNPSLTKTEFRRRLTPLLETLCANEAAPR
jgi:hypothetical protein